MTEGTSTEHGVTSEHYWQRLFKANRDFCSWQAQKQLQVRNAVRACLDQTPGTLRVLDFGIGSMGLYRSLEDSGLLSRILLTGISESQQHQEEDPLLARYQIHIAIGPGLSPLAKVADRSQDHVVCSYVFAYLSREARSEALQAFARLLVPNGKLTLVLHHARGERARKFRSSEPFWHQARELYEQLLAGRHGEANALLSDLTDSLDATFARAPGYRKYLASYLKTAARILSTSPPDGARARPLPDLARLECEQTRRWVERELSMTCHSFHPIENPATDLALPSELAWQSLTECLDPTTRSPIAHVLTAVKRPD